VSLLWLFIWLVRCCLLHHVNLLELISREPQSFRNGVICLVPICTHSPPSSRSGWHDSDDSNKRQRDDDKIIIFKKYITTFQLIVPSTAHSVIFQAEVHYMFCCMTFLLGSLAQNGYCLVGTSGLDETVTTTSR
jgi:hypothetical protein